MTRAALSIVVAAALLAPSAALGRSAPTVAQAKAELRAQYRGTDPANPKLSRCRRHKMVVTCRMVLRWTGEWTPEGLPTIKFVTEPAYPMVVGWRGDRLVSWERESH